MRRLALVGDVLKHLGTTARQLIIDALEATHHGISGGLTEAN